MQRQQGGEAALSIRREKGREGDGLKSYICSSILLLKKELDRAPRE